MNSINYSKGQLTALVALRIAIGWIMLYQGIVKFYTPGWTSKGFLVTSDGWFASIFKMLGSGDGLVSVLDFLNIYGQLAIGLGLILGVFVNIASIAAIIMLAMYYLSHPPFPGLSAMEMTNDLIVTDLILLIAGLFVTICFPTAHIIGLERLWKKPSKLKPSNNLA